MRAKVVKRDTQGIKNTSRYKITLIPANEAEKKILTAWKSVNELGICLSTCFPGVWILLDADVPDPKQFIENPNKTTESPLWRWESDQIKKELAARKEREELLQQKKFEEENPFPCRCGDRFPSKLKRKKHKRGCDVWKSYIREKKKAEKLAAKKQR